MDGMREGSTGDRRSCQSMRGPTWKFLHKIDSGFFELISLTAYSLRIASRFSRSATMAGRVSVGMIPT